VREDGGPPAILLFLLFFLLAICMDERTKERLLWEVFVVGEAGG